MPFFMVDFKTFETKPCSPRAYAGNGSCRAVVFGNSANEAAASTRDAIAEAPLKRGQRYLDTKHNLIVTVDEVFPFRGFARSSGPGGIKLSMLFDEVGSRFVPPHETTKAAA